MRYFASWHSRADFDGLKKLGGGFKLDSMIRGEMCMEKTEDELKGHC